MVLLSVIELLSANILFLKDENTLASLFSGNK
jgi:hypothetical protein